MDKMEEIYDDLLKGNKDAVKNIKLDENKSYFRQISEL